MSESCPSADDSQALTSDGDSGENVSFPPMDEETERSGSAVVDSEKGLTGPVKQSRRARPKTYREPFFPLTGSGPDVWRKEKREAYTVPFNPKRKPGTKPLKSSANPGLIFLTMIEEALDVIIEETNRHGRS
ncbi:MAG: hypothetical protein GY915_00105 [bacterium]|nr:hypothetical protein [bacterium]